MNSPKIKIEAFTFSKGENDPALKPPLTTAETKAEECEQSAKREKSSGRPKWEKHYREKARSWRKVQNLTEADINERTWPRFEDIIEGMDFLLACGERNTKAQLYLSWVIDHALRGLQALAADGKDPAAVLLIDRLTIAVKQFEFLAWHKPELFTHYTQRLAAIPATISPKSDNAAECKELLGKLEVGTKSIFSIIPKTSGNQWRWSTPANAIASRLINYIYSNRGQSRLYASCLEVIDHCPEWFPSLANLEDFGEATWHKWTKIAWEILKGISPEGKPEKHPSIIKLFNVRKGSGNDGATARSHIKDGLCGAFETIATGVSPRKRQRLATGTRQKP